MKKWNKHMRWDQKVSKLTYKIWKKKRFMLCAQVSNLYYKVMLSWLNLLESVPITKNNETSFNGFLILYFRWIIGLWKCMTHHTQQTQLHAIFSCFFNWKFCPVGWGCRIHWLHLFSGVKTHPQQVSWI